MINAERLLPLFPASLLEETIVWRKSGAVSGARLLSDARFVADRLPDVPSVVNICEDRYTFLVGLLAAMMRRKTTLLPPNRLAASVDELVRAYPGSLCLTDTPLADAKPSVQQFVVRMPDGEASVIREIPRVPGAWDAVLAFTSGSTGVPQAHAKRWAELVVGARCAAERFHMAPETNIVATVPAQHMYGLELSVLIPLAIGSGVSAQRPFFPEDVRLALQRVPAPRILVTTPLHLSACLRAGLVWPEIDFVISATAPLSRERATQAETVMNTRVFEIYGCTEAGSMASRRTATEELWSWYACIRPQMEGHAVRVLGESVPEAVVLSDVLELAGDGRFRLIGRGADMINIAGKRASLADLNLKLCSIEGVRDGAFLVPDRDGDDVRLLAVVVAPGLSKGDIARELRALIDPVFVPRRVYFVAELPRSETGKLPRDALLNLIARAEYRA